LSDALHFEGAKLRTNLTAATQLSENSSMQKVKVHFKTFSMFTDDILNENSRRFQIEAQNIF